MEYYVVDNFFSDVTAVRNFALQCTFYTKENHPGDIGSFPGFRSDYINNLDNDLYQILTNAEINIAKNFIDLDQFSEFWTKFSFSYTLEDTLCWEHVDFTDNWNGFCKFFGGIIYLHPKPPKNSGTILTDVSVIDNVYNRYVMYDATKPHSAQSSFGKNKDTGRLVLTHFVYFK